MITGDQSATAQAIGRQLGLSEGKPLRVLESSALDNMDSELLGGLAKDVHVFARVSPAHKLKIVQALQSSGQVVAMTGDGINDGPALKAADVGVADGRRRDGRGPLRVGTSCWRTTTCIPWRWRLARAARSYNNIRKTIHFMVSTNLTEIEVMLAGVALGLGQPMNPMQLLWINLVTDIFPGLALSLEPAEPDVMDRPPRDPEEKIVSGKDLKHMAIESGVIGAGTLGAYLYGMRRYGRGAPQASTLAFTTLTLNELAHAYCSRSRYRTLFAGHHLPPNKHLQRAIMAMAGAQALATWVPGIRRVLGTTPLGIVDFLAVAAGVLLPLVVNEVSKPPMPPELLERHYDSAGDDGTSRAQAASPESMEVTPT